MRAWLFWPLLMGAAAPMVAPVAGPAWADIFFTTDGAIQGGLCVGADCLGTEGFSDTTLRLKGNVLRLRFDDTSLASGFPNTDWALVANDPFGGGASYFAIEDSAAGTTPLRLAAGLPSHTLHLAPAGLGLGTPTPQAALHMRSGNSPSLRLEQDNSQAFAPQNWDLGGNEANFFIRDPDAGTLPFRIKPRAPTNSFYIRESGHIGMGTANPTGRLHIRANMANNLPHLVLDAVRDDGRAELWFQDGLSDTDNDALRMQLRGDDFNIVFNGSGGGLRIHQNSNVEVPNGSLIVSGTIRSGGSTLNVPDYVFAPGYALMPLSEVAGFIAEHSHLPHIPSAAEVRAEGLDLPQMQLALLKTVEEQMLHLIALRAELDALRAELDRAPVSQLKPGP